MHTSMHTSPTPVDRLRDDEADVVIVGYGPVGQVLAILLGQRGWRVVVVERYLQPYPMPRAVAFDSEGARILAAAGIGGKLGEIGEPSGDYTFENGDGQRLLEIEVAERGRCSWPDSTSMYQPALEAALTARGAGLASLRVLRGYEAVRLADRGDGVELVARGSSGAQRAFSARWVVGCDGANSFVRQRAGARVTDLGFSRAWLICDVVPHEPRTFKPNNLQICDPARPRTAVSAGPGHRRWEFMRVPGETVEDLNSAEAAWRLLALCDVSPRNATLERHHVYTFQTSYVDPWRSGRTLLAGDAAHLMPPFAGQGMCSGFRDVANLAWKLDLVLSGRASEQLLDTYTVERRAHVRHAIGMSVNLGKVICQTDPAAAADRDVVMRATRERAAGRTQQQSPLQPLTGGFLHRGADSAPVPPAGSLTPQARVARGSETGLFDDVVGLGFVLLTAEDPRRLLDAGALELLGALGAHLVHVLPAGARPERAGGDAVVDVDGVYLPYLAETAALGVLVRPDFYVFGAARDRDGLGALVDDMRRQLSSAVLTG
jgi:flavoprotein hydroxylase